MAVANVLKSKPNQKDLEKIEKEVGDKWRSLLTNLGEKEATIEGFLANSHGSTTEACFKGLAHWLGGNAAGPVTWETLLKALKESELKGFANDLEKELTGDTHSQSQGDQNGSQSKPSASKNPEKKFPELKASQELFELFKEEFLQDGTVPAQDIARRLRIEEVISQDIQTEIMSAKCDHDAVSWLYEHMSAQANKKSAKKLFDIMINNKAYQKMNDLGQRMLDAWQNTSASKDPEEQFPELKASQGGGFHSRIDGRFDSGMGGVFVDSGFGDRFDSGMGLRFDSGIGGGFDSGMGGGFDSWAFMDKFSERFLDDVDSHAIVLGLVINKIISGGVARIIKHCTIGRGNAELLLHLKNYASPNSISKLCDVMRSIAGYPKMSELGRAMKEELDLLTSGDLTFDQEYQEALKKHGKVSVKVIRSLLVGPSGVGKSSLRHLLVHGKSEDIKTSTPVMETPDVLVIGEHCAVDDKRSIWKQVTGDCLRDSLKQCTRERHYEESPHYPSTIGSSRSDVQAEYIVSHQDSRLDENSYATSTTQSTAAYDRLQTRPKEVNHLEAAREAVLSSYSIPEEEIPLQNTKFIHIIDSGGQPAFQDILPLLLAIPCVYLQIFDASKGFDERIQSIYRPESGSEQQLPRAYPAETHWEFIQRTLSSMQTMAYKFKCRDLQTFRHTPPEFRIIFVGTFKDKIKDTRRVKASIQRSLDRLQRKPYFEKVHFAENEQFFLVDNHMTLHSDQVDQEIESCYLNKLRECISDAYYALKVDVPLMWFLVEIITRSSDKKFIKEAELKEFCLKHKYIDQDEADKQFPCLLKLFHFLGFFAHYDLDPKYLKNGINYVCTDATSFYKEVSKLLAVQYSSPKSGRMKTFHHDGEIRSPYDPLFYELKISPNVDPVWFLEVLHHLGIAARLDPKSSHTPPSYFIPSCLPYRNAQVPDNCIVGPLCLTYFFEDGFTTYCDLPRSVFCRLVVELVKKKGWRFNSEGSDRTLIKFSTGKTFVFLTEEPGHIRCELAVCEHFFPGHLVDEKHPEHLVDKERLQSLHEYCYTLHRTLLSTLEDITRKIFGEEFQRSAQIHPVLPCITCQENAKMTDYKECLATCIRGHDPQKLSPRQKVWFATLESSEARVLMQKGNRENVFWNLEESNGVPRNTCGSTKMHPSGTEGLSPTKRPKTVKGSTKMHPSGTEGPSPTKRPKTVKELFKQFNGKFLRDGTVAAQDIARRLRDKEVIPQKIQRKIMNAECDYDAASILYQHMKDQANKESAKKLFHIMINAQASQNMNALGQEMLDALQNVAEYSQHKERSPKLVGRPESTRIISGHRDDIRQRQHGLHNRDSRKAIPKPSHSAVPRTWYSCLAMTLAIIMVLLMAVLIVIFIVTGELLTKS